MITGKVGSKGELFPPKSIRSQIGLKKGDQVTYRVVQGKLVIEKLKTSREILSTKGKIEVTVAELNEDD
ncbi:MAG: AbrB/MazE/SpoVT family DNA-binding domain-containing protein [Candidatus Heimdallarchaeota archaeon]